MNRIDSLEGLRGYLALWVLFAHVLALAGFGADWRGPFKVIASGSHAVDVFIILSGFVIFLLLDKQRESYAQFAWRRFWRLFPAYAVCCALMLAMTPIVITALRDWPFPHPLNDGRLQIMQDTMAHPVQHALAHITMLHSVIPSTLLANSAYGILGQAWSISLEWQFYLVAPIVYSASRRGAASLMAIAALAAGVHFLVTGWEGFLPRHIPLFGIGIASYFLWRAPARPDWPDLLTIAAVIAYFTTHSAGIVIWAIVFSALYSPSARGAGIVNAMLTSGPTLWLGRISYSIYLSHSVAMYAAMLLVAGELRSQAPSVATFLLLLGLTLGLTLLISALLFRFVEKPGMRVGHHLWKAPISAGHAVLPRS